MRRIFGPKTPISTACYDTDPVEIKVSETSPLRRPTRSLASLVAGFKAATTKRMNILRGTPRLPVWQRNYYEHIVRNDADLGRIREYIVNNPTKWEEDSENPKIREAGSVGERTAVRPYK